MKCYDTANHFISVLCFFMIYFQHSGWVHVAISWQKETGLNFYINGNLEGADWSGVRKIRETDADTRVIIGRRNDFLGDYSDVYFEELSVRYRFVEPWEAREVFEITGDYIVWLIQKLRYFFCNCSYKTCEKIGSTCALTTRHTNL